MSSRNYAVHSYSSLMKGLAHFLLDIQNRFNPVVTVKVSG